MICVACSCVCAYGQTIAHPWSVQDGGGGKSAGSGFTLMSSVGQPASGTITGTGFVLEGGFIPGLRQLSGSTSSLDVAVASAWNLLSVPFVTDDMRKTTLYSAAVSNAFAYTPSGYVVKDTLQNGAGYWLKFPSPQVVSMTGTSFAPETVDVSAGWNLIGTISYPALTANIVALSGAGITSPYFGYTVSGYYSEDTLKSGFGYWVKSSGSGKLAISTAPLIAPRAATSAAVLKNVRSVQGKQSSSFGGELDGFQQLHVHDVRGQERTLFFSGVAENIDVSRFELPPVPPGDMLDVRFRSQRVAELAGAQGKSEFPLQISGAVYPLTITWDGANDGGTYTLLVGSGKEMKEFPISGAGRVVVTDEDAVVKIGITSAQHAEMPKAYALYQNYPNPFNPSTTIRFDVPKASNISLKIYDVLGQEVETLVNEERGAGRYSVNFDAGNFPSGVYYFRIIAGDFSDVKKLLLAK
jgi:hypothetical protein